MSLSQPRQFFGIHSVSPYSRTDGTFYGILKVLGSSSLNFAGSVVESFGGSSKYGWAVEDGTITGEMNLKPKEFPDFLFTLFFGKAPTAVSSADTTGTLSTLTNVKGTSVKQSTTGIASVAITTSTGAAELKFGKYIVLCVTATTVDVYGSTDIDYGVKTTALTFQNDLLKITATALTITTSAVHTNIPALGVDLVGGSGTIGMTAGDTATFSVLPPSTKSMSVVIGSTTNIFPEFGAIIMGQRRSNGELVQIDAYRCKAVGLPIGFDEFKFAETDAKAKVFYDGAQDAVFKLQVVSET